MSERREGLEINEQRADSPEFAYKSLQGPDVGGVADSLGNILCAVENHGRNLHGQKTILQELRLE